jgi:hypothetical protein
MYLRRRRRRRKRRKKKREKKKTRPAVTRAPSGVRTNRLRPLP